MGFSVKFAKFLKAAFYKTPPVAASAITYTSVLKYNSTYICKFG